MDKKYDVSVRSRWTTAYCVVVILMVFCFFVGTLLILRTVNENAEAENRNDISLTKDILEKEWQDAFVFGMQVMCNNSFQQIETNGFEEPEYRQNAYRLSQNMGNYTLSNPVIEDFYMYYPHNDFVIGTRGVYRSRLYWALLYHDNQRYSLDGWKQQLFEDDAIGYFTVQTATGIDVYYRMVERADPGRVLVAKLDSSEISNELRWILDSQSANFIAIINDAGQIYASAGASETFLDENGSLAACDNSKYLRSELKSSVQFLKYVIISERNETYQTTIRIKNISLICLILTFASGLALSFYFTNKNMEPLQKITARFSKESGHKNEFLQIEDQLEELYRENQETLSSLARQRSVAIMRAFLNECIKPTTAEPQPVEHIAVYYGLDFENSEFMIVIRERGESDRSDRVIDLMYKWENEPITICWTERQNLDIFLLNFDLQLSSHEAPEQAFLLQLRELSGSDARIVCSVQSDNPEDIRSGYLSCLQQLKRKRALLGDESSGDFRVQYDEFRGKSVFGSFSRYLSEEDYAGALQMLPELCESYLQSGSELEKACHRYRLIQLFLFLPDAQFCERRLAALTDEQSVEVWRNQLSYLLRRLLQQKHMHDAAESDDDVAGRVRAIIDEEYANPVLDLRMIAESINLSQSYVSRMFKSRYEIGIPQYINHVRIEHAKELIRCGDLSIKAIALQVGYASDVQFIRVFKKSENITPGVFRVEQMERSAD